MPSGRDVELLIHPDRAAAVGQRHLLRRRHDDGADDRHGLAEAERDVAGARRHVDDQVVEILPGDLAEELLDRAVQHRSAPDDRRIVVGQEAHRHDLHAVLLGRDDLLAVGRRAACLQAEHDRHVRPVDVAVENADAAAALRQRQREVHRDRRLADAALARADGDDVLHAGQRRAARLGRRRRPHVGRHRARRRRRRQAARARRPPPGRASDPSPDTPASSARS